MKKRTISVTDAARNFADCVNRAHYQNVTFVLIKNGSPVARLTPEGERLCSGRDLAEALGNARLPDEEAIGWVHDLRAARKRIKTPADKWK
jgi:antitoxin (DNA-binding transcriptional repressor) of toxin-antitoxin stability system